MRMCVCVCCSTKSYQNSQKITYQHYETHVLSGFLYESDTNLYSNYIHIIVCYIHHITWNDSSQWKIVIFPASFLPCYFVVGVVRFVEFNETSWFYSLTTTPHNKHFIQHILFTNDAIPTHTFYCSATVCVRVCVCVFFGSLFSL